MSSWRSIFFLITVVFADFLAGAEIDLLVPSFPEIQHVFHLTPFEVELLLSLNLIANCIGSLWMGSLGDAYGKKRVLIWGMGLAILGSLLTLWPDNFNVILLGRIFQGIGMAAAHVLTYALLADIYSPEKVQSLMGILNGAVGVGMASAPLLGSIVAAHFHWRGNLLLLLGASTLGLILIIFFLPSDTLRSPPAFTLSLRSYCPVLSSRRAQSFILSVSLLSVPYFVFVGLAPLFYIESLHISVLHFGYYQAALALSWGLVSFLNGGLLKLFGNKKLLQWSIGIYGAAGISIFILALMDSQDALLITMALILVGIGGIFPCNAFFPLALVAVEGAQGRLSALFVICRLLFIALALQGVSAIYDGSFLNFGLSLVGLMGALLGSYFWLHKIAPEAWK